MDVETAFLNGKVTTEVYVNQPKGFEDGTERVYKLSKALYGLRESPRDWYECFDKYVMKLGFRKSNVELCLYIHGKDEDIVYLLIYVDDLLICGKDEKKINKIKILLSDRFKMKDLGEIDEYLGITVKHDYINGKMKLNQGKYINSLATKFQIKDSKLYSIPMESNLKI